MTVDVYKNSVRESNNQFSTWKIILGFTTIFLTLFFVGRFNFLMFHTLAELFAILVAWSLFVIMWNTKNLVENKALVFIGIAYLFVGGIDLVHTLLYKGMGFLEPERGADPATQLWILARYVESITLCVFPFLFFKKINPYRVFGVYAVITFAGLLSILYWDIFPVCYIDGTGLTLFKKTSEYLICLILAAALVFLRQKKSALDPLVYRYIAISIILTIFAELAFTFYVSVYGLSNLVGHFFKILSFYFIYRALIRSGLTQPQSVLFSKLRHSEERYRSLIDFSPLALVVTQKEQIVFVNPAAVSIFGVKDKKEIIGTIPDDWIHPDFREQAHQRRRQVLVKGKPLDPAELCLVQKDGKKRYVLANIACIVHHGAPALMSVFQDITERKQADASREQLQSQLVQAQKMESIGSLAGGIAHDFNNILFPIVGLSEMMLDDFPPGSPEHHNAQEIFKAGKRGRDLVQQILSFSRQSDKQPIPVHIQKILKEVLKLCRATIPADIALSQDISNDCGRILADPTQIHQIAMNLITNAYHAVEPVSGSISVQLREVVLTENDLPAGQPEPGPYAMLSVSDTGTGIDPAIIDKIFDPYFTTKDKGRGTGLGLATVYGIVKEHGGDIKVSSDRGKGSSFHVYLPLLEKPSEILPEKEAAPLPGGTEHILLVDDEPPIVHLGKQTLERLGYGVTCFTGSADALAAFKADPARFDLVITDMNMPDLTGLQLAKALIAVRPDIPVVICTGFSERINTEKAAALGIRGFLMKPFLRSKMAFMVRKVLDQAVNSAKNG
ncbi:MAG TPA: MASE3 domain-containing protein [Desulfotignum sp.]|nr:MASE3 domain-containing protein [Desulfotignum sp.]